MIVNIELTDNPSGSVTFNLSYYDGKNKTPAYLLAQELMEYLRTRKPPKEPDLWHKVTIGDA